MILRSTLLPSDMLSSRRRRAGSGSGHGANVFLGHPGRCPTDPTHVALIFDDSGSVGSPGGNDPVGARFDEARLAIDAVARRCRCGQECVSVTHFDWPTSRDVPPTQLKRRHQIDLGLDVPLDGAGCSLLGPSLARAYELTEELPEHRHVLVVLSDFLLFDQDLDTVLAQFASFPGSVHAVVLRTEPPPALPADDRVRVTRVTYTDPPGAVAQAVLDALTTYRRAAPRQSRLHARRAVSR